MQNKHTVALKQDAATELWLNAYFDSINVEMMNEFITPPVFSIDGYKWMNDSVITAIIKDDDQLVCTKKHLWVFVNKKAKAAFIELSRECDRDYSQTYFNWKQFTTKDTVKFNVTDYAYNAEEKYLDSLGNYKEGFDYDNVDYATDSFTYTIKVRKDGTIDGVQTEIGLNTGGNIWYATGKPRRKGNSELNRHRSFSIDTNEIHDNIRK